ncbi:MAG: prepilin-type N-terminal cleavage/methylation domain-containing protein [Candidatus Omnitrophica bacterium]|nr:prepilin-type N-terminal cleavage/methylation domain-containing protein [Candidatus Omnitrophota bacterium]
MRVTTIRGFTLIELVIVIVILGLLLGLSASFSFVMLDTLGLLTRQANLQESAEVALSWISREVRRLKNDQSILIADASEFSFIDRNDITITYRRNGTVLERQQSSPASINELADLLLNGVPGLVITYYGEDPDLTDTNPAPALTPLPLDAATRRKIRRIEFRITLQDGTHTVTAQTTVRPRNLRHESYLFF